MIQLATALLPTVPTMPSAPGAVLSTTSDFALALAQLSASVIAPEAVGAATLAVPSAAIRVDAAASSVRQAPDPASASLVADIGTVPPPAVPTLTVAVASIDRQPLAAAGTILPETVPQIELAASTLPASPVRGAALPTIGPSGQPLRPAPDIAIVVPEQPSSAQPVRLTPASVASEVSPLAAPRMVVATATPSSPVMELETLPVAEQSDRRHEQPVLAQATLVPLSLPTATPVADPEALAAEPKAGERAADQLPMDEPHSELPASQPPIVPVTVVVSPQPVLSALTRSDAPAGEAQPLSAPPVTPAMLPRPAAAPARDEAASPSGGTRVNAEKGEAGASVPKSTLRAAPSSLLPIEPASRPPSVQDGDVAAVNPQPNARVFTQPTTTIVADPAVAGLVPAVAPEPLVGDRPAPVIPVIRPSHPVPTTPPVFAEPMLVAGQRLDLVLPSNSLADRPQEPQIVAAADRVARTLVASQPETALVTPPAPSVAPSSVLAPAGLAPTQPLAASTQIPFPAAWNRPSSEVRRVTVAVTPLRAAQARPIAAPVEQPAAAAFAAQLFAAAAPARTDAVADPLAELSAAFPLAGLTGAAPAPEQVAAAVPAQDVALDFADDSWMTGMIDRIETLRDAGGAQGETRIRLTPDALGGIDVAITRDDAGTLQVQLSTDTPQARAVLAEAAPRLADMAEARGLKLGGSAVDTGAGQPGGERRDSHQPTPARPRPASARADTPSETTDHRIA
ncbi:Flagellar hook-length control protein FliK [Sphingomonas guangdongensis]|uniref:Flagellar hook-length control protein FliK n=1 Tax=Sphingomonas guangdongensis TaxID=1141890 RepID=A0A285QF55_9SPHN|nr:flagellar hook-length control protein FliK [Sphingomonas guangdongensis]SOB80158.1 Flagellar hook-length control protein FliK [Sphingomonas guangdongensis]